MLFSELVEDPLVPEEEVGYRLGKVVFTNVRMKLFENPGEENSPWVSFRNPLANPVGNHLLVFGLSYSAQSTYQAAVILLRRMAEKIEGL